MASRELSFGRRELYICDGLDNDCYTEYRAIANQRQIMETARVLRSLGEELARDSSSTEIVEGYFHAGYIGYGLKSVISTVDTLLEWLERSGNRVMKDMRNREAVLRGVVRLTELGSQVSLFRMLEIACEFLDTPGDPWPVQREFITTCLAESEDQKQRIFRVTEQVSNMLRAMIDGDSLDISKAMQFDNVLREASLEIESFARRLKIAKEKIVELTQKMHVLKWVWRFIRAIFLGASCFFLYRSYDTIGLSMMLVGFCASAVLWLSFFGGGYVFTDALSKLDTKHRLLEEYLNDVHMRLNSTTDFRDKVMRERDTVTSDE